MSTIARAMSDALTRHGGIVHAGTEVSAVDVDGTRATGVRTADVRHFACDALVLTADLPVVDRLLDGAGVTPPRGRTRGYAVASPSAVVFHGTVPTTVTRTWPSRAHHTLDFGAQWSETFARITAPPVVEVG